MHVDVHVGRGRLGAPQVQSRAADHPAEGDDVLGAGQFPDQAERLVRVDVVELGRVVEIADCGRVVEEREAARVQGEVVAERPAVGARIVWSSCARRARRKAGSAPIPARGS
jgi:hypothetical protein